MLLRTLWFFVKLGVLVAAGIWLAERPGRVSLDWLGYRIDAPVGVLLLIGLLVCVAAALLYRFWHVIWRTPGEIGKRLERTRRERGYKALAHGMVAVAAGEPDEAQRWARKADSLLDQPPLTMLLSAQAAQLGGDERAAERYFEAMLENEETRFLGLRGLLMQALKRDDHQAALGYVREAHRMRPKTPWVLETLFDLSERTGELESAERALSEAAKRRALPPPQATRRRAVLQLERAFAARANNQPQEALALAKEAHKLAPELAPASALAAELFIGAGRSRDAARLLERAWAKSPHPELARLYLEAKKETAPLDRLKAVRKLTDSAPRDAESRFALAQAALEAQLWGEARRYLGDGALEQGLSERACRLMARIEEAEHQDGAKARDWLFRAAEAPRDPAWACDSCGAVADRWSARCGACHGFDTLAWRTPPHVEAPALLATDAAVAGLPVPRDASAIPPARPAPVRG